MSVPMYYALVALFVAVFSLFRYAFSLGLLERPLVVGLVWCLLTGEWISSMSIAIFFELAWLDIIPAGTFIPPHLAIATAASLALTKAFGLVVPGEIMLAMVVSIPLSWIGARGESALRTFNSRGFNAGLAWARQENDTPFPDGLIYRSMVVAFLATLVSAFVALLVLHFLTGLLLPRLSSLLLGLQVTWAHLWLGASLGGILSLRIPRAYALFAAGVALVIFISVSTQL
ncbi:MAG: PTS sugar transporter subunit IIC [Proteobacteria bacterium]|nr:PTS sugar transporter subunit IIC [Pseudomonadota bacterium]MBU1612089.1 PTS sugar transporter subunit IIC [Pseudomonadota bacterium]